MIRRWSKLGRYIMSGGTAAIVTISFLFVFTHYFHVWYVFSSAVAYACGFVVSFTLQKFWTFRDHDLDILGGQLANYFVIFLCNLVSNSVLIYIAVEFIHVHYLPAQVISGGLLAFISYFLYKKFVFSSVPVAQSI